MLAPDGGSAASAAPGASAPAAVAPHSLQSDPPVARAPENASVLFKCLGAPRMCSALRNAFAEALQKEGLPAGLTPDQADVVIEASVTVLDERTDEQFGTTFVVRTFAIDVGAEAPRLGRSVPMPATTSVSFDARFGQERLAEKARTLADDAIARVRNFWRKR
jgi:hypothetical protein